VNLRGRGLLIGGLVGALLGALVAWIILDGATEPGESPTGDAPEGRLSVRPGDAVKLLSSAAVLVRQIADIRERPA
jgi:hypothetical protein